MASYQDIESRLRSVEDMLKFVMTTFTVTRQESSVLMPGTVLTTSMTLLDVYREMKSKGAIILPFPNQQSNETAPLTDEVNVDGSEPTASVGV